MRPSLRLPLLTILAAALGSLPTAAQAQRLYRLEVGAAGMYQSFDQATDLASSAGGLLRIGYWLPYQFGVELEGSYVSPRTESAGVPVDVKGISASLLYNIPLGTYSTAYLRGGYGSFTYGGRCPPISIPGSGPCGSTGAIVGGVGVRLPISQTIMIRTEGAIAHSSSFSFSNLGASLGLSLMLGSSPLDDTDEDGVYDRYDDCAGTRLGALVDESGCPTDNDSDGVPDGIDRCPSTASGAAVDATGCPRDSDNDNVLDGIDQCSDTPPGAIVDNQGCPSDEDEDGIVDGLDRCPATQPGAVVDRLGCEGDQDNDRVPDGLDQCPGTIPGTTVNAFGCSLTLDSDADGIPDAADQCLGTVAGAEVDVTGCPLTGGAPPEIPEELPIDAASALGPWTVPGSAFEFQETELGSAGNAVLDSVVAVLLANPDLHVEIAGHAHDRLGPEGNQRLSIERAQAVRLYLLERGVAGTQLTIKGYGAQRLIAEGSSDEARRINRRVEITITSP